MESHFVVRYQLIRFSHDIYYFLLFLLIFYDELIYENIFTLLSLNYSYPFNFINVQGHCLILKIFVPFFAYQKQNKDSQLQKAFTLMEQVQNIYLTDTGKQSNIIISQETSLRRIVGFACQMQHLKIEPNSTLESILQSLHNHVSQVNEEGSVRSDLFQASFNQQYIKNRWVEIINQNIQGYSQKILLFIYRRQILIGAARPKEENLDSISIKSQTGKGGMEGKPEETMEFNDPTEHRPLTKYLWIPEICMYAQKFIFCDIVLENFLILCQRIIFSFSALIFQGVLKYFTAFKEFKTQERKGQL
ncbi:unnamed protein product [Paramecium octaurelia]|uniref:Transmembrane protein n=1 Tax=Paramecium octaurelia TaxID=43137 RepID=A0A8S1YM66_PAROT|nr:unnamed protein product [Paramecium octaurelia]